jgi:cycloeucalenol cycloisomerase
MIRALSWLLSSHPGKRATERFWLAYTPVWGAIAGIVMVSGLAERWGDAELMALGVGLALPAALGPLFLRVPEERDVPLFDRAGVKLSLSVTLFSLLLNYSQTWFFFDVLHARYGFNASIKLRDSPVFLYFMTVAYFATYSVILLAAYRASQRWLAAMPRLLRMLGAVLACVVVALLETAFNATPLTQHLYCFDDMQFALWFGSLVYGLAFVCVLPVWVGIDERPGERRPWTFAVVGVLAAVYVDSLMLDLLRHQVAPHLTRVVDDAATSDLTRGCLAR